MANGDVKIIKLPIPEIIRNIVHQYAGEPIHNIIIKDIEDYGLELLEYRYEQPMYLYKFCMRPCGFLPKEYRYTESKIW
jgi:hypothetical protein